MIRWENKKSRKEGKRKEKRTTKIIYPNEHITEYISQTTPNFKFFYKAMKSFLMVATHQLVYTE